MAPAPTDVTSLELIAAGALATSLLALWGPRPGASLMASLVFWTAGLASGWVTWPAIAVVTVLVIALVALMHATTSTARVGAWIVFMLVALALGAHIAPGFATITLFENVRLSLESGWSGLRLTADKPVLGYLVLLAHRHRLCRHRGAWLDMWRRTRLPLVIGLVLVYASSILVGYIGWDPSVSWLVLAFIARQLIFTVIAEEAFFRLILQQRLSDSITGTRGPVIAWVTISLLFGLAHLYAGIVYAGLATLAGALYGYVFMRSGRVESAMLSHLVLNTGHLLLFTYPHA